MVARIMDDRLVLCLCEIVSWGTCFKFEIILLKKHFFFVSNISESQLISGVSFRRFVDTFLGRSKVRSSIAVNQTPLPLLLLRLRSRLLITPPVAFKSAKGIRPIDCGPSANNTLTQRGLVVDVPVLSWFLSNAESFEPFVSLAGWFSVRIPLQFRCKKKSLNCNKFQLLVVRNLCCTSKASSTQRNNNNEKTAP